MNDEEFQDYIEFCFEKLESKQQNLIDEYGFGSFDRYQYNFEKEEIYLLNEGVVQIKAKLVPVGSFNTKNNTWLWGGANDAFPHALREKASKIKQLESITGFEMFGQDLVEVDADMAWEIAAMALELLDFEGIYRGPSNDTHYFYAMEQIERVNS